MHPLFCSSLILLGSAAFLPAATFFTEAFSDGAIGTNFTIGTGFGTPTTSFATNDFTVTSGTGSRVYLGTVATDYSTVNFVFQATVTVPNADAWAIAFFGMGNPTAGSAVFGEPITGSNLFMAVRHDITPTNRLESRDNATSAVGTNQGNIPAAANGTHLLRMTWNAATQSAFFEYDSGNNGSIDQSFTVNGADNGFNGSNSQLVLGGGNGIKFDNISVTSVPEPSIALLGGLGALALLRRRR